MNQFLKVSNLVLLLCFSVALRAANVYILFDADCMDRMVYSNYTNGVTSSYLVYRVNQEASPNKMFLEIGANNPIVQDFLPNQVYTCGNTIFDEKLVRAINDNKDRVFLVLKEDNNRYSVTQVNQAAYLKQDGDQISYESSKYSFEVNPRKGIIGENIASNKKVEIFFEGKIDNSCSGAFLFRQNVPKVPKPYTDFVLLPEIGIAEERNGQNPDDAANNMLRLEKINDALPEEYLKMTCNGKTAAPKPENYDKTDSPDLVAKTPFPSSAKTAGNPCDETSGNGYHIVQKGEWLYKIAKLYKVSAAQIKVWNGLSTDVVRPCDKLLVVAPSQQRNPDTYEKFVSLTQKGIETATETAEIDSNVPPAWQTTQGYHVVLRGETMASIARKYGYTEARFREINGFDAKEVARVGQPLRTSDCLPNVSKNNSPTNFDKEMNPPMEFTPKSPTYYTSSYDFNNDERIMPQIYQPSNYETTTVRGASVTGDLARRTGNTYYDDTLPQSYDAQTSSKRIIHTVKEGENLYRIARMYGTTVTKLMDLNNFSETEILIPGQKVNVGSY